MWLSEDHGRLINGTIIRKNMVIFLKTVYNTYKNQWGNEVEINL